MEQNKNIGMFLETLDEIDRNALDRIRNGKRAKRVPGIIMSTPGIGKTTTVSLWAQTKGYNLITLTPSTYGTDDILGLQSLVDGKLVRLTPAWFNQLTEYAQNGHRNVLFIDEISATNDFLQPPLFRLVFDRMLGEIPLPQNTLIVAAGNYSGDLNNTFKMTGPLVNRFMILNITNEDIDLRECLTDDVDDMEDEDLPEFLGIKSPAKLKYDYNRFKEWVLDNLSEFKLGKAEYTDDVEKGGLLGFSSPRIFSFAMKFAETFMSKFNSPIWMRIVGDSLGLSNKREGVSMRDVLKVNSSEFEAKAVKTVDTFESIRNDVLSYGLTKDNLNALSKLINNATLSNTTNQDMAYFADIYKAYPQSEDLSYLNRKLISKMS